MIFPGFPGVFSLFQVFQVEWEPCQYPDGVFTPTMNTGYYLKQVRLRRVKFLARKFLSCQKKFGNNELNESCECIVRRSVEKRILVLPNRKNPGTLGPA